jgi:hypothetical protein
LAIDADAYPERWVRAVLRFQTGRRDGALADCEFLLQREPAEIDIERVRELHRTLKQP